MKRAINYPLPFEDFYDNKLADNVVRRWLSLGCSQVADGVWKGGGLSMDSPERVHAVLAGSTVLGWVSTRGTQT